VVQHPLRQWATGRNLCFFVQELVAIVWPSPLRTAVELSVRLDDLFFEFGIHNEPLVLEPDLPLVTVTAIEASAGHGTVIVGRAAICLSVQMHAVPIGVMGNQVGPAEFPADDAFLDILSRQGEEDLAACGAADRYPALAVYLRSVFRGILVMLWVLVHHNSSRVIAISAPRCIFRTCKCRIQDAPPFLATLARDRGPGGT